MRRHQRIRRELRILQAWQETAQPIIQDNRDTLDDIVRPKLQDHEARITVLETV
jgi:hypothetical protein